MTIMTPIIRQLDKIDYLQCWQQMQAFTAQRNASTPDEVWLVEHDPIFTLGLAGKEEHLLSRAHQIPLLRTDRGGQITYHGPQQIIIYLLIDIKRLNLTIRQLVSAIEAAVITFLASLNISAYSDKNAPGVYVAGKKIASLGLKIRQGRSYHGLSFNYAVDTTPFTYINPCGYSGLKVVNLIDILASPAHLNMQEARRQLTDFLLQMLYTQVATVT